MEETTPSEGIPSSSKSEPPPSICALQKRHSENSDQDGRSSPEPNCAICLCKLTNKSFTDSCLHQFCFKCLLEWSKVKAQCPLCKQSFKSIIHNVRSEEDYDQYHVTSNQPAARLPIPPPVHWDWGPRFRYRTTMTTSYELDRLQDRDRTVHEIIHFVNLHESFIPPARSMNTRTPFTRRRQLATAEFRRTVYRNDMWTRPLPDLTGRHRQCTPEFFRMNPAQIHRLVPWLNRELSVLLQIETHMAVVLDIILNLCVRHPIRSDDMRIALIPYLGHNTNHFLHEFYTFASSPYDLIGYDCESQYAARSEYENQVIETPDNGDSDSSDIIILDENPEPSARRSTSTVHIESSDSEVEFVGYVKPRHERTPVLVNLDDDVRSEEPVAGPSTQMISDSEIDNLPWISDDDLLIALNPGEDDNISVNLDLTNILSQSSSSYDNDPDYRPSFSASPRVPSSPKKKSKRKQRRMSRSSSSSSNSSRQRESSSASTEHYVPPKSYKKSSKYPKKVTSHKINPKSSKNARSNRIDSDSSSKRVRKDKSSKKMKRRVSYSTSENERPRRKKYNRKRNHSSSWRIKTPKSESEDEEVKMENRPRLRSIVISKAALNNNNNATSSSSYSSSSSSSLNFKSNKISNSKNRISSDTCSSE